MPIQTVSYREGTQPGSWGVDDFIIQPPRLGTREEREARWERSSFVVATDDADFYYRVYHGADFPIGSRHNHRAYYISPRYSTRADLVRINALRAACDFGDGQIEIPIPHRAEIEALPLPG